MAFLIRQTAKGFRVLEESYNPRTVKTVPPIAYKALGFNPDMSLAEAKARATQINLQSNHDDKRYTNIARRVELLATESSMYLPSADVTRFEQELADMYLDNPYRLEITLRYWKAAQLCILELAIDPKDFRTAHARLTNYFKARLWSHDYIKRITRILDMWGYCVSRHRGSLYEPIPKLSSLQVQRIVDLRDDVEGVRLPARPLQWIDLKNAKDEFESDGLALHWNWMFIAMWFGLRQTEVDNIRKGAKYWYVKRDPKLNVDVLWIYQTKLTRIAREKRWKPIPIYFKEQKDALGLIIDLDFKRPLNKSLYRILGDGIQTGSPRKGFTDHMLELGFDIVDISIFLGHHTINRTMQTYKDRQKFKLPKSS